MPLCVSNILVGYRSGGNPKSGKFSQIPEVLLDIRLRAAKFDRSVLKIRQNPGKRSLGGFSHKGS